MPKLRGFKENVNVSSIAAGIVAAQVGKGAGGALRIAALPAGESSANCVKCPGFIGRNKFESIDSCKWLVAAGRRG